MKRANGAPPSNAAFALFVTAVALLSATGFGRAAQGQAPVQLELERTIALPIAAADHAQPAHSRVNPSIQMIDRPGPR